MVVTLLAILGSYSRGAYITLAVLAFIAWLGVRRKLVFAIAGAVVFVPLLIFMPESFYERAESIQQYQTDTSFQTRLDSWWVAWRYAMDHIPFGAGFYGLNLQGVWDLYIPGERHAAHSIYFQVLGEQGVVGLALYLMCFVAGFRNLAAAKRDAASAKDLLWARDLARALQLSLLAFCVGGAGVPMDFFDLPFLWILLSAALLAVVQSAVAVENADGHHGIGI